MSLLILVVDDEPDVEVLFCQQFRRDLRAGRFAMEFASSAALALQRIANAGEASLILITAYGDAETKRQALERGAEALLTKPIDFALLRSEIESRVERTA